MSPQKLPTKEQEYHVPDRWWFFCINNQGLGVLNLLEPTDQCPHGVGLGVLTACVLEARMKIPGFLRMRYMESKWFDTELWVFENVLNVIRLMGFLVVRKAFWVILGGDISPLGKHSVLQDSMREHSAWFIHDLMMWCLVISHSFKKVDWGFAPQGFCCDCWGQNTVRGSREGVEETSLTYLNI